MSVEQIKAFYMKLAEDSALAQKLKDAQAAYTGDKSDKDAAIEAVILPIAAEAGFIFTAEDLKSALNKGKSEEEGEASEDELDAVAGGVTKDDETREWQEYFCGPLSPDIADWICDKLLL